MKTIKTAILSFGMSGQVFHAPFIDLHPGFELVGAWERSKDIFTKHYPHARRYGTLEDILSDPEIALVVVNTPTYTHYEYAKLALNAGKHVVVEKAFTTTMSEAQELKQLAEDKGRMLSVYQNRRWDSDFLTVKQVVASEVLGQPVDVSFCFDRYSPELSHKQHKEVKGPGAGIVKDLGPHVIDQALHLYGKPEGVFAKISNTRATTEVDDYFKILLFYPNHTVTVRGGYFFKEQTPAFIVHGKKGSLLKSRADVQESQLQGGMKPNDERYGIEPSTAAGVLHYEKDGAEVKQLIEAPTGDYKQYYAGIYEALISDTRPPVTAEEGLQVMQVIESAFQSNEEQRVISLN